MILRSVIILMNEGESWNFSWQRKEMRFEAGECCIIDVEENRILDRGI